MGGGARGASHQIATRNLASATATATGEAEVDATKVGAGTVPTGFIPRGTSATTAEAGALAVTDGYGTGAIPDAYPLPFFWGSARISIGESSSSLMETPSPLWTSVADTTGSAENVY